MRAQAVLGLCSFETDLLWRSVQQDAENHRSCCLRVGCAVRGGRSGEVGVTDPTLSPLLPPSRHQLSFEERTTEALLRDHPRRSHLTLQGARCPHPLKCAADVERSGSPRTWVCHVTFRTAGLLVPLPDVVPCWGYMSSKRVLRGCQFQMECPSAC